MQKQAYKRQMQPIVPDESLVRRTAALMVKRKTSNARRRVPVRAALIAAVAMLLLTGIALASGFLDSVFLRMKGRYTLEVVDYETVQQTATKDVFGEQVALPGTDVPMEIRIKESYYDGESMMLGFEYNVPHRPASFDFGPNHDHFADLEPLNGVMVEMKSDMSEADYLRYQSELKANGKVGVLYFSTYLSDGVYGENGEALEFGEDVRDQLPDGTQWRMLEIEPPLPESLRNLNEISIRFSVVQRPIYFYEDETGQYWSIPFDERVVIPLTARIEKSDVGAVRYVKDAQMKDCAVHVDALVSPAYVKATFTLDVPGEWSSAAEAEDFFTKGDSPVDFICDFILVGRGTDIDGEIIEAGASETLADLSEISGTYPPPREGEKQIVFRPVYINSGPRPEEDIVIDIMP